MKNKKSKVLKLYTKGLKQGMDESLIQALQDRIKELETINEEHRKINGELRKTINEAIEYLEYQIPQLDFEKDMKAKMLGAMVLVLLQGKSDE